MKIDKNSYSLSDKHFHSEKYKKRKIVLSNSLCGDMKFFRGWELRRNGTYKKVTHFSVDTNGKVYEHYNPTYHSEFMGSEQLDKETITINIVNQGWLKKDPNTNKYKDWIGTIYKGIDVFKKEWRGHFFWASYNKEQMDSVGELVDFLCDRYKIERNSLSHNVMFTDAPSFNGVLSRSNFSRKYKDVSPSFDFGTIDNKLLKENIDD
jgi:N-acetyl-anhydromuramyl-L-alanine amidase AmpD